MNASVFWRLVWKEYRLQRAFWISMAVLTVLVQLLVLAFVRPGPERITWLFAIGLGFPAFYALGCGATLFATEHEAGTYGFQRALPVSAMRLFGGKLAFAVVSTLLLLGLLWSSTAVLAGWRLPRGEDHLELWGLWGLAAVELLMWGILFSLLFARPLLAAILAVTAASVSIHVATGGPAPYLSAAPYSAAVPLRAAIAALVALADLWLGCRWFRERIVVRGGVGVLERGETASEGTTDLSGGAPSARTTVLGRLLWHQWRQSVWAMAGLSVLLLPVLLTVVSHWGHPGQVDELHVSLLVILALAAAPLMGACVFHADQRDHGFRFLAERGIRPGYVWLSRHVVWVAALLSWAVLVNIVTTPLLYLAAREAQHRGALLEYVLALAIFVGYPAGQLVSMFLRSGILAGFFGLVLSGLLCGWAGLMLFLQVPWIWSIAPIPLALLLATWLRAPDWLLERNTLRAWLGPALAMILPATAVLTAVPLYRVYDIPAVDPGFSPEEFARPATAEEKATFEMYREAALMYVPMSGRKLPSGTDEKTAPPEPKADRAAREKAWIEANEEVIALTVKASRQPACDFFDPRSDPSKAEVLRGCQSLSHVLVASAGLLQSEGKLEAAWQRYLAALRVSLHLRHRGEAWFGPHIADWVEASVYDHLPTWAAQPDQTPQRIEAAIRELEKLTQHVPSRSDAFKSEYLWTRRVISGDPVALAQEIDTRRRREFWAALAVQRLPWERARVLRVLNLITARDLKLFGNVESAISREASFAFPDSHRDDQEWLALMKSTPVLAALHYSPRSWWESRTLAKAETRRRAVRLLLALQAWKIEHGELPKTLDELVGPYLERLPVDPYCSEPFRYFPNGLPIPITSTPWPGWSEPEEVPAGRPFIWSTGENVIVKDADEGIPDRYRIPTGRSTWRWPTSEYEVWDLGWPFPLP